MRDNLPEFNLKDFRLGMHYFLKNNDYTAARALIFIGEQNNVRKQLEPAEQKAYVQLFEKYGGKNIADDTTEYLENYARIENNATGRHLRDGTTNLLFDLKKRQLRHEDKSGSWCT